MAIAGTDDFDLQQVENLIGEFEKKKRKGLTDSEDEPLAKVKDKDGNNNTPGNRSSKSTPSNKSNVPKYHDDNLSELNKLWDDADFPEVDDNKTSAFLDDPLPLMSSTPKTGNENKDKSKTKKPNKKVGKDNQYTPIPAEPKVAQLSRQHRIRSKKLIIDRNTKTSSEELKSNMQHTDDLLGTIDLAPHSKRLMLWKETGRVEKLLILPGRQLSSRELFQTFKSDLHGLDNEVYDVESQEDIEIKKEKSPKGGLKRSADFYSPRVKNEPFYDAEMNDDYGRKAKYAKKNVKSDDKGKSKATPAKSDEKLENLVFKITSQLLNSNAKVKKESESIADEMDFKNNKMKKDENPLDDNEDIEYHNIDDSLDSDIELAFEPSIHIDSNDSLIIEKVTKAPGKPKPVINIHNILGSWRKMPSCKLCGEVYFVSKKALETHQAKRHSVVDVSRQIRCTMKKCPFTTTRLEILHRHLIADHVKRCNFFKCQFTAYSDDILKVHIEAYHMKFYCQFCEFRAVHQSDLNTHIVGTHMKIRCNLCDFRTGTQNDLEYHIDIVHFKHCSDCEFKSMTQFEVDQHYDTTHTSFKCDKCNIEFKRKIRLESHIISTHVLGMDDKKQKDGDDEEDSPKSEKPWPKTDTQNKSPNMGRPMRCSRELSDIIGCSSAPMNQIIKSLWSYLKRNNLQCKDNGHYFIPDRKMSKIFGNEKVKGFTMSKYLKTHLIPMSDTAIKKLNEKKDHDRIEFVDDANYTDDPTLESNKPTKNPLEYSSGEENTKEKAFWSDDDDWSRPYPSKKMSNVLSDDEDIPTSTSRLKTKSPSKSNNGPTFESDNAENSDYNEDPLSMPSNKEFGFGERSNKEFGFGERSSKEFGYGEKRSRQRVNHNYKEDPEDPVLDEYPSKTVKTIGNIEKTINSIDENFF